MVSVDQSWQASTAQFYEHLYACVWQNLEAFVGVPTTLELLALSKVVVQESYPFLAQVVWSQQGLEGASLVRAMASEERAHVEAGCEQHMQSLLALVQDVGGGLLPQRLRVATEQLRLRFDPALSHPTPLEDLDHTAILPPPQEAALSFMPSVVQQGLILYRRVQEQQRALVDAVKERQEWRKSPTTDVIPQGTLAFLDVAQSEAFYHSLFDLAPDGVLVTDTSGTILHVNPRAAEILEYDTPQDILGLDMSQFYVHPERRVDLVERVSQRQRVEGQRGELRTRRGRTIIVVASSRLIDYDGKPCILSVVRDVTERARLQQEMEDFAYSASHDLQAPLRTFEGYARWLLEDYGDALDSTGRQLCQEIIDDALHMKKLLDGLLEYSRIGRVHTQAVPVDVHKVLERVLHDLQLEIADTGGKIHLPEQLPTVVYPEVRLTQIFSNLLSNALKFTAGRAPDVTVSHAEQERYHCFAVRDNGIGIAAEHLERIFEIFKRLHTREEYPGTGAGLTIVKKIVEAHGGQIGVESVPGEGSTFWFTIPKTEGPRCVS